MPPTHAPARAPAAAEDPEDTSNDAALARAVADEAQQTGMVRIIRAATQEDIQRDITWKQTIAEIKHTFRGRMSTIRPYDWSSCPIYRNVRIGDYFYTKPWGGIDCFHYDRPYPRGHFHGRVQMFNGQIYGPIPNFGVYGPYFAVQFPVPNHGLRWVHIWYNYRNNPSCGTRFARPLRSDHAPQHLQTIALLSNHSRK